MFHCAMGSDLDKEGSSRNSSPFYRDCLLRLQRLQYWSKFQFAIILGCLTIAILILLFPLTHSSLDVEPLSKPPIRSREAYATFLSDVKEPWYSVSTRLLTFQFKHDPVTMDPDRDFVVLTTPHIPLGLEEQLRREGATVERRELIRGMPGELDPYGSEQWKDQYSKLHVFNLTMYERILFLDSDMVINQPMQGIWEDQAAWPKSGLASTGGNNFDHPTPPLNDRDDFNGGFWLVRPSADLFETLLKVRGYNDWDKEQVRITRSCQLT